MIGLILLCLMTGGVAAMLVRQFLEARKGRGPFGRPLSDEWRPR